MSKVTSRLMDYKELNTKYSAFAVFFDDIDGAMEVWPQTDMTTALAFVKTKQDYADSMGYDACYMALPKLPRRKVYKCHKENPNG